MLYMTLPTPLRQLTPVSLAAFWSIWVVLCMKAYMIRTHPTPMNMASAGHVGCVAQVKYDRYALPGRQLRFRVSLDGRDWSKDQRPTVRELAWQSIEPNQFGTDEFMRMASMMDWTPMVTVNLGTGTPEEARNWVEYCNCPVGSRYANLRAENGSEAPYQVKLWGLGNEMDGPWQLGHVPADQYAILAQQAAKLMKDTDPNIETVACGTCSISLPTYMEWDRTVLEYIGPYADYVSLHRYVGNPRSDTVDYLAVTNSIDQQIEEMDAVCRFVQARSKSKKRHYLCFDEWNVWYRNHLPNIPMAVVCSLRL